MHVEWVRLSQAGRSVEGQMFRPDRPQRRLVLFCPGFPGMGAVLFEQRHAAVIAEAGYDLLVLRHNGMRLDGPHAPAMVNNGVRLMAARKAGEAHLGGGPSTLADWMVEPLTVLRAVADDYDDIHVIGNSFGALSSLWSLTEVGAPGVDKVRHILLLAGAQGIAEAEHAFDAMRIWKPEFLSVPRITDKIDIDPPESIIKTLAGVFADLPARVRGLPESIPITCLVVARDELLHLEDTRRFCAAIGRGKILLDEIDQPHYDHNLLAHDTPDFPAENLLALLDQKGSHDGFEGFKSTV